MVRPIGKAATGGFALAVAVLAANAIVSFYNIQQLRENDRLVANSHEVLAAFEATLATFNEARNSQRVYLITKEARHLEPFDDALTHLPDRLQALEELTAADPGQRQRVAALGQQIRGKLDLFREAIDARKTRGILAARQLLVTDKAKQDWDTILKLIREIKQEENDQLRHRLEESRVSLYRTIATLFLATFAAIGLVGLTYGLIRRDLLGCRQAEETLRRHREWSHATLASIADAVIATDAGGRITFMNAVAQSLTGWKEEEGVGRPLEEIFRLVDEETQQPAGSPLQQVLQQGAKVNLANHTVLLTRGGARVPVADSAAPIRSERGDIVGGVVVFQDVTRRRRAEAALSESEQRYRSLAESVPGMVWTARPDGSNDYANRRWYDYTGLTPEQSLGFGWTVAVHPDDLARTLDLWKLHLESGEPGHGEVRLRRRDGAFRWFLLRTVPLRDRLGRVRKWFGTSTDIDDGKRAAEALRESEERFRRIVETAAEGVGVIDAESRITYVNRRMAKMLGSTVEDMLGRFPNDFLFAEDVEAARHEFRLKRAGNRGPFDFRLRRKDGSAIWASIASSPMFGDDGRFVGVLGMFSDVTDRKRLEEALKEADRRKDEFLAMLAHELRNPLASVGNAAQVLKRFGPADPQLQWAREVIDRQLRHLSRLVDDLLDVSRITHGKVTLQKEPVELAAVVARAVETVRPLIEDRGQELSVSLPPGPVRLEADLTRLAQVLGNLLTNATRFTGPGGRIGLTAAADGAEVVLRVRDSGIGIPAELLPQVFDLFTQGDRSPARSEGGLGVGLTLVKSLVEMHGGRVQALSDGPGKGAEFVVRLPIVQAQQTAQVAAPPEHAPVSFLPRRILVVDDHVDTAELQALLLRAAGHEVRTAHDGPVALEAARAFRPGIVILDIGLPGMDGYEVARRLRGEPGLEEVLLIALTGYGRDEDRRRCREVGFDHHLVKPVDSDALQRLCAGSGAAT
jgi:PAS domain S-box-containing protein